MGSGGRGIEQGKKRERELVDLDNSVAIVGVVKGMVRGGTGHRGDSGGKK